MNKKINNQFKLFILSVIPNSFRDPIRHPELVSGSNQMLKQVQHDLSVIPSPSTSLRINYAEGSSRNGRFLHSLTFDRNDKKTEQVVQKLLYILIIVLLSCINLPKAFAAANIPPHQNIRVSPVIFPVNLSPGKSFDNSITIENLAENPIPLQLQVESFSANDEEGGYNFNDAVSPSNPLAKWIHIPQPDMILEAREVKEVRFQISVPLNVPIGGYYAMLFVTPMVPIKSDNPNVAAKIGVLVLGSLGVNEVTEAKNIIQIPTFSLIPIVTENGQVNATLRAKNISLNFLELKPIITLKTNTDKDKTTDYPDKIIFPGKIRRWNLPISVTAPGLTRVILTLSMGKGMTISKEQFVILIPHLREIAALIFILIFLLTLRSKHVRDALKALITGK
jgi:hypothetical protein